MKRTVKVVREELVEIKNAYVRWDDYSGGDSAWRGGRMYVADYGKPIQEKVKEKILDWCRKYLPCGEKVYDPPEGWEVEFEIEEFTYNVGREFVVDYVKPLVSEAVKELIIKYAPRSMKVELGEKAAPEGNLAKE